MTFFEMFWLLNVIVVMGFFVLLIVLDIHP